MRGTANKFPTTRHYGMHNMRAEERSARRLMFIFNGVGRGFELNDWTKGSLPVYGGIA